MPKNIVICCDGTGNEINTTISNVLKLFRVLPKDEGQRVYYHPGVGTIGLESTWGRFKQEAWAIRGLATGAGLDEDTLAAYRFLCRTFEKGDKIWLFGFSRGAYTVRVLAAFIQVMGLLPPDQIDLAPYALTSYKNASATSHGAGDNKDLLDEAWHFSRIAGAYHVGIEFMGVWDTVASVIVPRPDKFWFDLQSLVYTRTNPSVKTFRQAIAIDERRRMFRLNRWTQPQKYRPDIFNPASAIDQDIRQVWFAGVHCDVGGGYPEEQSAPSKFPLLWMIDQAVACGLRVDPAMVDHLGWGLPKPPSPHVYVPPSATAPLHDSLTGLWWILEWLPKREKWREWKERLGFLGWYLPRGEPRLIPDDAIIHQSVIDRMAQVASYRPVNMPSKYTTEPGPSRPGERPAGYGKGGGFFPEVSGVILDGESFDDERPDDWELDAESAYATDALNADDLDAKAEDAEEAEEGCDFPREQNTPDFDDDHNNAKDDDRRLEYGKDDE